jgi:hypothetical protein
MNEKLERAIRAVGGVTETTYICRCSSSGLWKWRQAGYILDGPAAKRLADAATEAGFAVTTDELVDEAANGNGGAGPRGRRFRKGGHMITATYQVPSPDLPVVPRFPDAAARAA